jgi:hypothetical protein
MRADATARGPMLSKIDAPSRALLTTRGEPAVVGNLGAMLDVASPGIQKGVGYVGCRGDLNPRTWVMSP